VEPILVPEVLHEDGSRTILSMNKTEYERRHEMIKRVFLVSVFFLLIVGIACAQEDSKPPRVVSTVPENGSQDVDPSIKEISVTFNEEMTDGNWSWVYEDQGTFPQIIGQAYYSDNNTKNILPVKLEPNKAYVIWINSADYKNFKNKKGIPAVPFKFTFKTK
jgi:outer membrane lipoprotein-sorting protein